MREEIKFVELQEKEGITHAVFTCIQRGKIINIEKSFSLSFKYLAFWARGRDTNPAARMAYEDALMALPKDLQLEAIAHWENLARHYSRTCAAYHQSVTYVRAQQRWGSNVQKAA